VTEDAAEEISRAIERDCRRYPRSLNLEEEKDAPNTDEL
jgi:hypothetical protein